MSGAVACDPAMTAGVEPAPWTDSFPRVHARRSSDRATDGVSVRLAPAKGAHAAPTPGQGDGEQCAEGPRGFDGLADLSPPELPRRTAIGRVGSHKGSGCGDGPRKGKRGPPISEQAGRLEQPP